MRALTRGHRPGRREIRRVLLMLLEVKWRLSSRRDVTEASSLNALPRGSPELELGREALATLGAAARKNLLTASGQHALAEAVAALAHDAARLISTFHGRLRQVPGLYRQTAGKQKMIIFPWLKSKSEPLMLARHILSAARSWCLIGVRPGQVNGCLRKSAAAREGNVRRGGGVGLGSDREILV